MSNNRNAVSRGRAACMSGEDVLACLRGESSSAEQAAFEEHCKSCHACSRLVAGFRAVQDQLRHVPTHSASQDLAFRIHAAIPEHDWTRTVRTAGVFPALSQLYRVAAAIVLLLAAAWIMVYGVRQHDEVITSAAAAGRTDPAVQQRNQAIAGGLAWLAANQETDGSWSAEKWGANKEHAVGITALSILALIGKDQDQAHNPYAGTIRSGIEFLIRQQNKSGRIGPACANAMYNHGMATVAILRAYRLDIGNNWKGSGDRAIGFICTAQKSSGGWGYVAGNEGGPNTSVSVWQLQALILAKGQGNTALASRIHRSMDWLRGMVDNSGHMGYSREEPSPDGEETLTAAGALCLLADDTEQRDEAGAARLVRSLESAAGRQDMTIDYYRWYFVTQALQAAGGKVARDTAGHMKDALVAQQAHGGPGAGSWDRADRWTPAGGRIYSTSMALLSLE
ncbi:MAG: prenyltransferase/squalene oxidase repeat-containing protein [bacterium]